MQELKRILTNWLKDELKAEASTKAGVGIAPLNEEAKVKAKLLKSVLFQIHRLMNPKKTHCKCGVEKTPETTHTRIGNDYPDIYYYQCKECVSKDKKYKYWEGKSTEQIEKSKSELIKRLAFINNILDNRSK